MGKKITYKLSNQGIADAVTDIQNLMEKKKCERRNIINTSLFLEESLMYYQSIFGEEKTFHAEIRLKFFRDIRIVIEGDEHEFNIFQKDNYLKKLSDISNAQPSWSYKRGSNIINIPFIKSRPSQILQLVYVIFAVILFCVAAQFVPADIVSAVHEGFITPTKDFLLTVLLGFACPVIFFSVFLGILNIADLNTFKNSGTQVIKVTFLLTLLLLVVLVPIGAPLLTWGKGSEISIDGGELFTLILGMIPTNPISPFVDCNAVQVIILAMFCAIVCMILGKKIKLFKDFMEQASLVFEKILNIILFTLPVIMFFVLSDTFISPDVSTFTSSIWLIAFCALGVVIMLVIQTVILLIVKKKSIISYLKNAKDCLIIALSTASSMAAYPNNVKTCTEFLEIDENLTKFGIPLCQVLYCPALALVFCGTAYFGAMSAGTVVSVTWIIAMLIVAILLACSVPPVPGGMLAILTIFVTGFSLPTEFVAIASAVSVFMDFPSTLVAVNGSHTVLSIAQRWAERKQRKKK